MDDLSSHWTLPQSGKALTSAPLLHNMEALSDLYVLECQGELFLIEVLLEQFSLSYLPIQMEE